MLCLVLLGWLHLVLGFVLWVFSFCFHLVWVCLVGFLGFCLRKKSNFTLFPNQHHTFCSTCQFRFCGEGYFFRGPSRTEPGHKPSAPRRCHKTCTTYQQTFKGEARHREETTNFQAAGARSSRGAQQSHINITIPTLVPPGNSRCKQSILLWQKEGFFLCIRAICNTAILLLLY